MTKHNMIDFVGLQYLGHAYTMGKKQVVFLKDI